MKKRINKYTAAFLAASLFVQVVLPPEVMAYSRTDLWKERKQLNVDGPMPQVFPGQPTGVSRLKVPEKWGNVVGYWSPKFPSQHPPVIHIQDIHNHSGVQRNIAHIIQHLSRDFKKPIHIGTEGGWQTVDLRSFANGPLDTFRENITSLFLEKNYLTGAQFFALNHPPEAVVMEGLENRDTYVENLIVRDRSQAVRNEMVQALDVLEKRTDRLAGYLLPSSMRTFLRVQRKFEAGDSGLVEYADYLIGQVPDPDQFPNLSLFVTGVRLERGLDEQKIGDTQRAIVEQIGVLGRKEQIQAVESLQKFTARGQYSQAALHETLSKVADSLHIPLPPEWVQWGIYLSAMNRVETKAIMAEIRQAEDVILANFRTRLSPHPDVATFMDAASQLALQKSLWKLELSPETLQIALGQSRKINWDQIERFYNRLEREFGLIETPNLLSYEYTSIIGDVIRFYDLVQRRDQEMADRLIRWVKINKAKGQTEPIFFVAGGFHTAGITARLKDAGIPYLVVQPSLTVDPNEKSPYEWIGPLPPVSPSPNPSNSDSNRETLVDPSPLAVNDPVGTQIIRSALVARNPGLHDVIVSGVKPNTQTRWFSWRPSTLPQKLKSFFKQVRKILPLLVAFISPNFYLDGSLDAAQPVSAVTEERRDPVPWDQLTAEQKNVIKKIHFIIAHEMTKPGIAGWYRDPGDLTEVKIGAPLGKKSAYYNGIIPESDKFRVRDSFGRIIEPESFDLTFSSKREFEKYVERYGTFFLNPFDGEYGPFAGVSLTAIDLYERPVIIGPAGVISMGTGYRPTLASLAHAKQARYRILDSQNNYQIVQDLYSDSELAQWLNQDSIDGRRDHFYGGANFVRPVGPNGRFWLVPVALAVELDPETSLIKNYFGSDLNTPIPAPDPNKMFQDIHVWQFRLNEPGVWNHLPFPIRNQIPLIQHQQMNPWNNYLSQIMSRIRLYGEEQVTRSAGSDSIRVEQNGQTLEYRRYVGSERGAEDLRKLDPTKPNGLGNRVILGLMHLDFPDKVNYVDSNKVMGPNPTGPYVPSNPFGLPSIENNLPPNDQQQWQDRPRSNPEPWRLYVNETIQQEWDRQKSVQVDKQNFLMQQPIYTLGELDLAPSYTPPNGHTPLIGNFPPNGPFTSNPSLDTPAIRRIQQFGLAWAYEKAAGNQFVAPGSRGRFGAIVALDHYIGPNVADELVRISDEWRKANADQGGVYTIGRDNLVTPDLEPPLATRPGLFYRQVPGVNWEKVDNHPLIQRIQYVLEHRPLSMAERAATRQHFYEMYEKLGWIQILKDRNQKDIFNSIRHGQVLDVAENMVWEDLDTELPHLVVGRDGAADAFVRLEFLLGTSIKQWVPYRGNSHDAIEQLIVDIGRAKMAVPFDQESIAKQFSKIRGFSNRGVVENSIRNTMMDLVRRRHSEEMVGQIVKLKRNLRHYVAVNPEIYQESQQYLFETGMQEIRRQTLIRIGEAKARIESVLRKNLDQWFNPENPILPFEMSPNFFSGALNKNSQFNYPRSQFQPGPTTIELYNAMDYETPPNPIIALMVKEMFEVAGLNMPENPASTYEKLIVGLNARQDELRQNLDPADPNSIMERDNLDQAQRIIEMLLYAHQTGLDAVNPHISVDQRVRNDFKAYMESLEEGMALLEDEGARSILAAAEAEAGTTNSGFGPYNDPHSIEYGFEETIKTMRKSRARQRQEEGASQDVRQEKIPPQTEEKPAQAEDEQTFDFSDFENSNDVPSDSKEGKNSNSPDVNDGATFEPYLKYESEAYRSHSPLKQFIASVFIFVAGGVGALRFADPVSRRIQLVWFQIYSFFNRVSIVSTPLLKLEYKRSFEDRYEEAMRILNEFTANPSPTPILLPSPQTIDAPKWKTFVTQIAQLLKTTVQEAPPVQLILVDSDESAAKVESQVRAFAHFMSGRSDAPQNVFLLSDNVSDLYSDRLRKFGFVKSKEGFSLQDMSGEFILNRVSKYPIVKELMESGSLHILLPQDEKDKFTSHLGRWSNRFGRSLFVSGIDETDPLSWIRHMLEFFIGDRVEGPFSSLGNAGRVENAIENLLVALRQA